MFITRVHLIFPRYIPRCCNWQHIFGVLRRNPNRILTFTVALLFALVMGCQSFGSPPKGTEILWDTYGVPHIYGKDTRSALYAFGWAQMQSHGNLILRLYGQARGRAAEYWGEKYTESDRWVLTMGVPERARSWYEAQNPSFRSYLDAFAEGINTYVKENKNAIDDSVEVVLPVKGEDVLAHLQRVLNFTFIVSPEQVAGVSKQESIAGSNGWAIAPKRSASGNAMLLANPHLPWSDLYLWYEAQITAPGIDAYGTSLVGIPVLTIAFNNNLGWTHTVNTHDGWDAYQLELAGDGYRFDGKVSPFETKTLSLKVKQNDGTLREQPLVVKSSVHGPVVSEKEGKATALRVVGLDQPGVLEQWWDMARSQNMAQFEKALQRLQLPMFTVMYADREGHIMHLFNGQVPVREQGDFKYWQGIIPGNTSKTLWTKIHPYKDLPRVIDPPSGWLQNTNDPPWTTTFPVAIKADKYPPYMAPRFMDFRAQSSARMLDEDEKITLDEMIKYKHSTRMEFAERILDDLIPAARKYGKELGKQAATTLEKWDRQANADSKGAVLFAAWVQELDFDKAFNKSWSENSPRTTPDGLANPQDAVKLLETAAAKVEKAYRNLDVAWGEVFRLKYGNVDLPGNGGDGDLGIFRVVDFAPSENGRFQAVAGDSYVAAIEFSKPVKAMALMSYGNSSQPGSRHVGEQLQMFAEKKLRPVWRKREEITPHLKERKVF
ncbi:MAG: acylase [Cyanomargarita calcarea GSE-NOS-MK-12-04C]|jgi:acyl-homoserine-lactone acylase|uniref:Acylase n=1 Tax=Cyanomargarita calcarea GSE-NOS-MK-12-04C TaxID=2839659 RepID=A0A951QKD7_9CYAN|nr:acylase [Cyanomargarita calcarea GSE-NOS-MK-12-04C]